MTRITWIKALSDTDETPVNGQFFDMSEPLVTMVNPNPPPRPPIESDTYKQEYLGIRRNSYIYRLMVEAGYYEKGDES